MDGVIDHDNGHAAPQGNTESALQKQGRWISESSVAIRSFSNVMKILCITPVPPSPRLSGTGIRLFNCVRALASCGEVTLVTLVEKRHEALLEDCRPWCEDIVTLDAERELQRLYGPVRRTGVWDDCWKAVSAFEPVPIRNRAASELARLVKMVEVKGFDLIWITNRASNITERDKIRSYDATGSLNWSTNLPSSWDQLTRAIGLSGSFLMVSTDGSALTPRIYNTSGVFQQEADDTKFYKWMKAITVGSTP